MGSVGNQSPWLSYENYRDCSLEICSIYCPQFCYLIFPPPPRPSDDDSGSPFSPLIIAIIGVLASAFLLVSYYTIVTRYCKRRTINNDHNLETEENRDELAHDDQWQQIGSNGLDESLIEKITVCKYEKGGGGIIEGTECAVCLSEFQENESLRLLPKCSHAFHLPCIDMWLKSHSNCPLCRANVLPAPAVHNNSQASPALNANPYEIQRPDDLVLVVDGRRGRPDSREWVVIVSDDDDRNEEEPSDQVAGVERFRGSVTFGTFPPQQQISISDILRFEEIDEYVQVEIDQLWRGIGSWEGGGSGESKSSGTSRGKAGRLLRSPVAMKRSVSTERFMGKEVNDRKGNSSMIPN